MTVQELIDDLKLLIDSQNNSDCHILDVRHCEVVVNGESVQSVQMFESKRVELILWGG